MENVGSINPFMFFTGCCICFCYCCCALLARLELELEVNLIAATTPRILLLVTVYVSLRCGNHLGSHLSESQVKYIISNFTHVEWAVMWDSINRSEDEVTKTIHPISPAKKRWKWRFRLRLGFSKLSQAKSINSLFSNSRRREWNGTHSRLPFSPFLISRLRLQIPLSELNWRRKAL